MKIIKLGVLSLLVLFTCIGCEPMIQWPETHAEIPISSFETKFSPSELKNDLDFLFDTLETVHPNLYFSTSQSVLDQQRTKTLNEITSPLTRKEFWLKVSPLVILLNDGHTNMRFIGELFEHYTSQGGVVFPLELDWQGNDVVVVANYSTNSAIVAGDKVSSINNVPVAQIREHLFQYVMGEESMFKEILLEKHLRRWLWEIYKFEGEYELKVHSQKRGQQLSQTVTGITEKDFLSKHEARVNADHASASTFKALSDKSIAIMKLNSFEPVTKDKFIPFLEESFATIQQEGIQHLIIDLRENGGGNFPFPNALLGYITERPIAPNLYPRMEITTSPQVKEWFQASTPWYLPWFIASFHPFFEQLSDTSGKIVNPPSELTTQENPLRYNGKVYVLIGNYTFSAASMLAVAIKDFQLGTLIGEETGGRANFYGSSYQFDLPATGIPTRVSYAQFIRPSGELDDKGALPDHEVNSRVEDKIAGIDTVMEYAITLIESSVN